MLFGQIQQRQDGSYIITKDGYPYHVPNEGEFADLFLRVQAYAAEYPDMVTMEPEPDPPTPAELVQQHNAPIIAELDQIDRKSARALRAIVADTATDDDRAMLTELNARAEALRAQLQQEVM